LRSKRAGFLVNGGMSLLRGEEIGVSGGDIEYKKKKKKKRRKRREIPNHHHPYR